MPLYMTQFAYTPQAWGALAKRPEDRSAVLAGLLEKSGGRLHSLYYCFGEYDGVAIFEAPDETAAVATLVAVVTPGHVRSLKTTVLLTVEQTVAALRKAGSLTYRGPNESGGNGYHD